jgi:hypothetical protein
MFPGETLKVALSFTDSAKRRVAFLGRIEEKKSSEHDSGAAVTMGRAATSEEARVEERMAVDVRVCGDQHEHYGYR